jgi:hypothetical protein
MRKKYGAIEIPRFFGLLGFWLGFPLACFGIASPNMSEVGNTVSIVIACLLLLAGLISHAIPIVMDIADDSRQSRKELEKLTRPASIANLDPPIPSIRR